ncbi:hypothetical protein COCON_G00074580 [Conger conger]|uniref:Uncharacterized protein n=1 Tax=Conger conger TaxID=82655 RepID=A0A9Q1I1C4_CONCO|nr:hypothetical protein COCON_G00074580 [Conger conger]
MNVGGGIELNCLAAAGNPSHIAQYLPEDVRGSKGEEEKEKPERTLQDQQCEKARQTPLSSASARLCRLGNLAS